MAEYRFGRRTALGQAIPAIGAAPQEFLVTWLAEWWDRLTKRSDIPLINIPPPPPVDDDHSSITATQARIIAKQEHWKMRMAAINAELIAMGEEGINLDDLNTPPDFTNGTQHSPTA